MKCIILAIVILLPTGSLCGQPVILDQFIDSYAGKHNFSGTILVQRRSKIAYARSFGFANRQHRTPNRIETKYKIASLTKAFTAVMILRLYERGKIDLGKTIKTYLPDYAGEAADKVTIHQLLNHTAGMENIDRNVTSADAAIKNGIPHYQTPMTTDVLLVKYCGGKLINEPGKVFSYNNADYIILGKIIERLHGKTFDQVLKEDILQPLKMANSGMFHQYAVLDNLADTYFFREDLKQMTNDLPFYMENVYAAGAMYSTVGDVLKFSNALFNFQLLKKETLERMLTAGLDEYGYGVWVYRDYEINGQKYTIVKRPGRVMGAQGMLFHLLNVDATVIILSNTDAVSLDEFAAEIGKRLAG